MSWDNSISLSDIISIAALLATLITVILIFVQRSDSAKPMVFVRTKNNKSNKLSIKNDEILFDFSENPVEIGCFGNSFAKDVVVESYFILDRDNDFYNNIKIKGGVATFLKDGTMRSFFFVNPTKNNYEIINRNEVFNINQDLQGKLFGMAFCGYDAVMQLSENTIPVSCPCIAIRLQYSNIHGRKYKRYYSLSCRFDGFSREYYSFILISKSISKHEFNNLLKAHKKQNCCGWFRNEYDPVYK